MAKGDYTMVTRRRNVSSSDDITQLDSDNLVTDSIDTYDDYPDCNDNATDNLNVPTAKIVIHQQDLKKTSITTSIITTCTKCIIIVLLLAIIILVSVGLFGQSKCQNIGSSTTDQKTEMYCYNYTFEVAPGTDIFHSVCTRKATDGNPGVIRLPASCCCSRNQRASDDNRDIVCSCDKEDCKHLVIHHKGASRLQVYLDGFVPAQSNSGWYLKWSAPSTKDGSTGDFQSSNKDGSYSIDDVQPSAKDGSFMTSDFEFGNDNTMIRIPKTGYYNLRLNLNFHVDNSNCEIYNVHSNIRIIGSSGEKKTAYRSRLTLGFGCVDEADKHRIISQPFSINPQILLNQGDLVGIFLSRRAKDFLPEHERNQNYFGVDFDG